MAGVSTWRLHVRHRPPLAICRQPLRHVRRTSIRNLATGQGKPAAAWSSRRKRGSGQADDGVPPVSHEALEPLAYGSFEDKASADTCGSRDLPDTTSDSF